jgi:thiamine-monophosphate kinase
MSFTPVSSVGEFGLIDRLRDALGRPADDALVQGVGDDAAVYRIGDGRVHVVTTDLLVEGVHFDRTFVPMRYLGWKAVAVNVSDVAAMNARPRWVTVGLGLPNNVSVEQLEAMYEGMAEACAAFGCVVVGGDTVAAARLTLAVTVVGEAEEGAVVYRSGARPGGLLCVTGDLGSAAAGLRVLLAGKKGFETGGNRSKGGPEGNGEGGAEGAQPSLAEFAYAVERQLYPRPRLDRVAHWAERGVKPHALIDVSDGLASEVHHLCRASGVGAVVEAGLLPVHVQTIRAAERFGEEPAAFALYGGEDYELLFALPESLAAALDADTFAVVGHVVEAAEGVTLRSPDGEVADLGAQGFQHF